MVTQSLTGTHQFFVMLSCRLLATVVEESGGMIQAKYKFGNTRWLRYLYRDSDEWRMISNEVISDFFFGFCLILLDSTQYQERRRTLAAQESITIYLLLHNMKKRSD